MLYQKNCRVAEKEDVSVLVVQYQEFESKLKDEKKRILKNWTALSKKDFSACLNQPVVKRPAVGGAIEVNMPFEVII